MLGKEKICLHRKTDEIVSSIFNWYTEQNKFLTEHCFLDFKVVKQCSGYQFLYFLISGNKYFNGYF